MIGSGVFLMPAALAAYGSISLLGWLFSSIGAFLIARIFCSLSKCMPASDGGPYAYTRRGLGDFAGFLVAWGYVISCWCTNAAIAVAFVSAMSTFFPVLKSSSVAAISTGLATIWLLTWINTRGVVASGRVQLVTTILKIIPLLAVAIGSLFFIQFENFIPFNAGASSNLSAITATTTLTFFAFLGIESATIPSSSVANPGKTIARATMLGTLIAMFIYILSSAGVMGMIPSHKLKDSVTPFADAASMIWGSGASYLVSAGVAVAALGALNGYILLQGQVPYAIAKDNLFPPIFGKQNKKAVPAAGIVIGSVLVSLLMAMNYTKGLAEQFKFLILLSTLTVLVPYLFSSAAYLLIKMEKQSSKLFPVVAVALLAFLFSLWMVAGSGQEIVYWGFMLVMAGIPFYVWVLWRKNKKQ